jgi:hypothetical protein
VFDESSWMSINRRCLEEGLSVQDMLSPAPPTRTGFTCTHDRCVAAVDSLVSVTRSHGRELHHRLHAGQRSTGASEGDAQRVW